MKAPPHWQVATVAEICEMRNGHGFGPEDWTTEGLPIIRIQNLNGGKNFDYFAGEADPRWLVKPGQLLFAWAGTKGVSFGPTVWRGPLGVLNQHIFQVDPKPGIDVDWLHWALRHVTDRIEANAHGFKATLVHVKKSDIDRQPVRVPPIAEQRCIARVLATWDKAIAAAQRLVANSHLQKQALLEALTSGQCRFKGETRGWTRTALKEVATVVVSSVNKKHETGERRIRLCNYTDVYYNDRITAQLTFMDATASAAEIAKCELRAGDVIITKDSETADDIAVAAYVQDKIPGLVCGYHLAIVRPDLLRVDPVFLHAYFKLATTRSYFASNANGVTRFGLPIGAIQNAPICLPDIPEQRRIAAVLSTSTDSILRVGKEVDALKSQRTALMAQLLSGKRCVRMPAAELAP